MKARGTISSQAAQSIARDLDEAARLLRTILPRLLARRAIPPGAGIASDLGSIAGIIACAHITINAIIAVNAE